MIFSIIKDYPDYVISSTGKVYTLKNASFRQLSTQINYAGYERVGLCKNGKQRYFSVHRLVAEAFIPNPKCLPCVNHKDENKLNNLITNLEWCTWAENNKYGTRLNRIAKSNKKKIIQLDFSGNTLKIWDSQADVGRILGLDPKNINACLHNRRRSCGGYIWRFAND